jgi:hypothetical protein
VLILLDSAGDMEWFDIEKVAAFFTTGTYVKIQVIFWLDEDIFCILFVRKDDIISFHLYLRHSSSHPHPLLW